MREYKKEYRELKDYVQDIGYRYFIHKIGNRFRGKNLLILTSDEKRDIDGALKIKDGLYDYATTACVKPVLRDTSVEEIEPHLKDVSEIILFKEVGQKATMKPLISLGREIKKKYGINYYPAAYVDLNEITSFHFASKNDEKLPECYITPIRKIYEFTHDYVDHLIALSIGEESKKWADSASYFIKQFMKNVSFIHFTLNFVDGIEGIRKEDLKYRRAIAFEETYNENHLNRLKRELLEDGYGIEGLMYFSVFPEPYAEIFRRKN